MRPSSDTGTRSGAGRVSVRTPATPRPGGDARSGGRWARFGASSAASPSRSARLHRLGAVRDAELAVERAGVLLDRVRREEEAVGDLAVGGARGDQRRGPRARASVSGVAGAVLAGGANTVIPLPTIRTALATSSAPQSLETKPEAPAAGRPAARSSRRRRSAARACCGEARADRLAQLGARLARRGRGRRARRRAAAARQPRAPPRRWGGDAALDPRLLPSRSRKPHWTTSWSSTTSTRSARSPFIGSPRRSPAHQAHPPAVVAVGPELDACRRAGAPRGRQAQADPGRRGPARRATPSFRTSSAKARRRAGDARPRPRRVGVLLGVAQRLAQDRDCASGSRPSGTSALGSQSTLERDALVLGRRAARARRAGSSGGPGVGSSERSSAVAQLAQRGLRSRRGSARVGPAQSSRPGAERERDAEQPLHDALVDLAGELDRAPSSSALALALARRAATAGGQRGACLPSARIVRRSSVVELEAAPPSRSAKITPSQRPAAATGVQVIPASVGSSA